MDALSRVLQLADVQGAPDLRCLLAGRFEIDHEPSATGEAPYHLVLGGQARVQVPGGSVVALREGDLLLLPHGSAHALRDARDGSGRTSPMKLNANGPLPVRANTDGPAELDLLCGRFTYATGPANIVMAALPDVLHVSLAECGDMDALRGVVGMLRAEIAAMAPGVHALVTGLSQVLFVLAVRAYTLRANIPPSLLGLLADSRLGNAVLAMLRHPEEPWTVESLAACAAMSRASFARHFSAKGDTSPRELLTVLRMRVASDLLSHRKLAIGDIAARVGYQSEAAFGKVFAKHTGMPPAAYRRAGRAGVAPR